MGGRIGAILAPLIKLLQVYHPAIPTVLYGTVPLIGGFLCFLLPETLNVELQDHTEERSVHMVFYNNIHGGSMRLLVRTPMSAAVYL